MGDMRGSLNRPLSKLPIGTVITLLTAGGFCPALSTTAWRVVGRDEGIGVRSYELESVNSKLIHTISAEEMAKVLESGLVCLTLPAFMRDAKVPTVIPEGIVTGFAAAKVEAV